MKIGWLDCFSGISGDMFLGALLDAGVSADDLRADLALLDVPGLGIEVSEVRRAGVRALAVRVTCADAEPERKLADIEAILSRSKLDADIREKALDAFRRLAEVEGRMHGLSPDKIHFHELGGADTIADIVGVLCGLKRLGLEALYASPVNVGSGTVKCAHGTLPVPAPATAELLRDAPVRSEFDGELTTPTGALLVTAASQSFGPMPPMRLLRVGHGAGGRDTAHPNVLRLFVGESDPRPECDRVCQVETNIDDMNPQVFGSLFERLAAAGALDVYLTPVQMKKNRPGHLLTAVCARESLAAVSDVILRETTTLGVRHSEWNRTCLDRRMRRVETAFGPVRVKVAVLHGRIRSAAPEFDDCARLAKEKGASVQDVLREAGQSAAKEFPVGAPDPGEDPPQ